MQDWRATRRKIAREKRGIGGAEETRAQLGARLAREVVSDAAARKLEREAIAKDRKREAKNTRARERREGKTLAQSKHAAAGRKGWRTRVIRAARIEATGARPESPEGLHGSVREDWHVLRAMMRNRDERWLRFRDRCIEEGMTDHEAADDWMSPEV